MSYLPRMSKSYKEPQNIKKEIPDEPEQSSSGIFMKPASSILDEKTANPQTVLKHYKYGPHSPPVLPGPSLTDEANEHEALQNMRKSITEPEEEKSTEGLPPASMVSVGFLGREEIFEDSQISPKRHKKKYKEASKISLKKSSASRISISKVNSGTKPGSKGSISKTSNKAGSSKGSLRSNLRYNEKTSIEKISNEKISSEKSGNEKISGVKSPRSSVLKNKQKLNKDDVNLSLCLMGTDISTSYATAQTERRYQPISDEENNEQSEFPSRREIKFLRRENTMVASITNINRPNSGEPSRTIESIIRDSERQGVSRYVDSCIQCSILPKPGRNFAIPRVISSLIEVLAFLFEEIRREEPNFFCSAEHRKLINELTMLFAHLRAKDVDNDYAFETTYSDFKRLEKFYKEFQKHVKDFYGEKGEIVDRKEDLRKIFVELRKREMELIVLNDKLMEKEKFKESDVLVSESDLKNPEVTLQNKRLESEQLLAKIQFSLMELRKYQKSIAEIEWEIKNYRDIMRSKVSFPPKPKTEIALLGKKISSTKFLPESSKGTRSKKIVQKKNDMQS